MNQSTFRESVEKIINKTITRETHKGTVNRVRFQVVEAITLAHEEAVKKVADKRLNIILDGAVKHSEYMATVDGKHFLIKHIKELSDE